MKLNDYNYYASLLLSKHIFFLYEVKGNSLNECMWSKYLNWYSTDLGWESSREKKDTLQ